VPNQRAKRQNMSAEFDVGERESRRESEANDSRTARTKPAKCYAQQFVEPTGTFPRLSNTHVAAEPGIALMVGGGHYYHLPLCDWPSWAGARFRRQAGDSIILALRGGIVDHSGYILVSWMA
jgi:hypothetical protein